MVGVVLVPLVAYAADPAPTSRVTSTPTPPRSDVPDAEMLRDLDLLAQRDFAGQRDLLRTLPMIERLRMLQQMQMLESGGGPEPVSHDKEGRP